jgi:sugar phosphate isomerase/epimerase
MKKLLGRLSLVHIKDMSDDDLKSFAEIGNGILDWDAIFAVAKEGGSKWLIVEQDSCARPPLESVKISFQNLKTMGAV